MPEATEPSLRLRTLYECVLKKAAAESYVNPRGDLRATIGRVSCPDLQVTLIPGAMLFQHGVAENRRASRGASQSSA